MNDRTTCAIMAALGLTLAMPSIAQALVDPTRPPYLPAAPADAAPRPAAPVLRSIYLSPDRRMAFIDGRAVQVGDAVGEARVVAIEMDLVRLRDPSGAVTEMRLVPEVKRPRGGHSAAERPPQGEGR